MPGHNNYGFSIEDDKSDENSFAAAINSRELLTPRDVELKDIRKTHASSGDYEPYDCREVERPTTNSETLLHLLKGSLGTGILAMPMAFMHSGWVLGVVATLIIGFLCTYCIHMLIRAEYELCKRKKVPSLSYPATTELALLEGPAFLKRMAPYGQFLTNLFLLVYQLGTCCVYTVFIAENVHDVLSLYIEEMSINIYMVIFLLPLILINFIKNLKLLAPFSTLANAVTIASFGIILYYLIEQEITFENKEAFGKPKDYPLYFGTVLFALEAIGVIMPLENEMKTPRSFGGTFGVLNIGMVSIITLYIGMGLLGYLAYGSESLGSVTFNIGDGVPAQVAKLMLSLAIFISHALQMYVAIDITWTQYLQNKFEKSKFKTLWEYAVRISLVLITFALAIAIPHLDLVISLFGALCLSALGLAFPAVIDTCTYWYQLEGAQKTFVLIKNGALFIFAIFGLIIGTYTSLLEIAKTF